MGDLALQFSLQQRAPRWTLWVLDLHRRAGRPLSSAAVETLHAVADLEGVRAALREYMKAREEGGAGDESLARLKRLAGGQ